jgi:hypothetical protein
MKTLIHITLLIAFIFIFTFCGWVFYQTNILLDIWVISFISLLVLMCFIAIIKTESKPNPRDED